jgi:hypothetical protein
MYGWSMLTWRPGLACLGHCCWQAPVSCQPTCAGTLFCLGTGTCCVELPLRHPDVFCCAPIHPCLQGSQAYAKALAKAGILTQEEADTIVLGLSKVRWA